MSGKDNPRRAAEKGNEAAAEDVRRQEAYGVLLGSEF